MQRVRAREETPTTGSQTITSNILTQQQEDPSVILHLHAVSNPDERRVTWDEEVIDNENMGKKSSKVCCIYHKPRQFGESSDESSSSSSSDESDSDDDVRRRRHEHNHDGEDVPNGGEPCERHAKSKRAQKRKRKPSPNAYERQPQSKGKKKEPKSQTDGTKT